MSYTYAKRFAMSALKTVLLTLLASGSKRGEIHAIAYLSVTHSPNWTHVVLHPVLGFISKTQQRT